MCVFRDTKGRDVNRTNVVGFKGGEDYGSERGSNKISQDLCGKEQ